MKALFIVPSDYDSLVAKGVLPMLLQRSEGGFLDRLWTVHPFALHDREIAISAEHTLIECAQAPEAKWRPAGWLRLLLQLWRRMRLIRGLIRRNRIDFVRAQDPYYCGLIGFVATRFTGAKFCISLHADYDKMNAMDPRHGAPKILGSRALANRLERFLLVRADRVLVISEYMGAYARRKGAHPASIRLFRHLIPGAAHGTDVKPALPKADDVPVIAVVSRLSPQKHAMDIVDVVRELRAMGVSFRLELAGDGPLRNEIAQRIAANGDANSARLLGFQSRSEVMALLSRASASLVLIGGASLLEAAAVSCPAVAYDCEWHSELIEDGTSGLLVPENDTAAAAKALARLLRDPELRQRLGRGLRERAAEHYDEARLLESRREVYRELVAC